MSISTPDPTEELTQMQNGHRDRRYGPVSEPENVTLRLLNYKISVPRREISPSRFMPLPELPFDDTELMTAIAVASVDKLSDTFYDVIVVIHPHLYPIVSTLERLSDKPVVVLRHPDETTEPGNSLIVTTLYGTDNTPKRLSCRNSDLKTLRNISAVFLTPVHRTGRTELAVKGLLEELNSSLAATMAVIYIPDKTMDASRPFFLARLNIDTV